MATATVGTSTVVFSNSGAAANLTNNSLTEDSLGEISFDVLAASGGGKNTTLYSVDDGTNTSNLPVNKGMTGYNTDLLYKDAAGYDNAETTANGGKFWIGSDMKIHYDASEITTDINTIPVGSSFNDTFQYTIKMANGTLAVGTLTVSILNTNDGPVVTASDLDGNVYENTGAVSDDPNTVAVETGSFLTDTGTITFDDADTLDTHTVAVTADGGNSEGGTLTASITDTAAVGDGTVTWTYSIDDALTQHLGAGDTATEKFTVTITDNHGASIDKEVVVTIHGQNDAANITDQAGGDFSVTEETDLSAGGTLLVSDVDDDESAFDATYTTAGTAGANNHGTFTFDADTGAWTYVLNNADAAVQALDADDPPLTDSYEVKSLDGTSHTITVTINGADEPVGPPPGNPPSDTNFDHDTDTATSPTTIITATSGGERNFTPGTADFNDVVQGNSADQTIAGNSGDDTLYGAGGGDQLNGGTGNDTLYGQAGNDNLNGGSGNDTLYGGSGTDNLTGAAGQDQLYGGSGADTFIFSDGDAALPGDTIVGFDNLDTIDLTAFAGTAFSSLNAGNTVVAFGLNYYFDGVSGDTILQGDTDGNTATIELQITLQDVNAVLTAGGNVLI